MAVLAANGLQSQASSHCYAQPDKNQNQRGTQYSEREKCLTLNWLKQLTQCSYLSVAYDFANPQITEQFYDWLSLYHWIVNVLYLS